MSTDPAILLFRVRNLYTLNDRCKHSLKIKTMSWCPSTVHMLHLDCWTVDAIRYSIYTVYSVLCNRFLNRTEHPIHTGLHHFRTVSVQSFPCGGWCQHPCLIVIVRSIAVFSSLLLLLCV